MNTIDPLQFTNSSTIDKIEHLSTFCDIHILRTPRKELRLVIICNNEDGRSNGRHLIKVGFRSIATFLQQYFEAYNMYVKLCQHKATGIVTMYDCFQIDTHQGVCAYMVDPELQQNKTFYSEYVGNEAQMQSIKDTWHTIKRRFDCID